MKPRKIPLRKCTGCCEMKDKRTMIRVVKSSDDQFSLDFTGKKPGRGAYICRNIACLDKAESNKGLEKSFKMSINKEIYKLLREEFESNGNNG